MDSDSLASIQLLAAQIDSESRVQEAFGKAEELNPEERQLLIDVLHTAVDGHRSLPHSQAHKAHVWLLLMKLVTSLKVPARGRIINSDQVACDAKESPNMYVVELGGTPQHVKVLGRGQKDPSVLSSKRLVEWAHLSHLNVLPLYYAAFLESETQTSFVSLCARDVNICEYTRELPQDQRISLIVDVINGLSYMHQLDIVHGVLYPEMVVISSDGRALITELDAASETKLSESLSVRYSAPEILEEDDPRPTKAADSWSFGCLCYEVISGKAPFFQFNKDSRISAAITRGDKPLRPGQEGVGGHEIGDEIWRLLLGCWEYRQ